MPSDEKAAVCAAVTAWLARVVLSWHEAVAHRPVAVPVAVVGIGAVGAVTGLSSPWLTTRKAPGLGTGSGGRMEAHRPDCRLVDDFTGSVLCADDELDALFHLRPLGRSVRSMGTSVFAWL